MWVWVSIMKTDSLNRNISIDLVKAVAIIFVVVIHSCTFSFPVSSNEWSVSLFYRALSGSAVPLFLMASGGILLNPQKEISLKKLYFKNILRIALAMFFWGFAYKIWHLYEISAVSLENVLLSVKELFFFNQEFHFYYMHIILIVYVFLPVTRIIIANSSKKQLEYLLAVWFIFAIVYPTVWRYSPFNEFGGMTTMYGINLTYASIGYGVLGYYLLKHPFSKWISAIIFIAGFLMTFVLTYYKSNECDALYEHFLAGNGVPVCLMAIGFFSFVQKTNIKKRVVVKTISYVSKASFCVYLIHILVMYILKKNGINTKFAPVIFSIPAYAISIFSISVFAYFILSKIPLIKKWLI